MKKIILLFLLSSSTLMAQEFNEKLIGKILPAQVIFRYGGAADDGKVKKVLMKYESADVYKNPKSELTISLTESDADLKKIKAEYIEAFMIDNTIWAKRSNPVGELKNTFKDLTKAPPMSFVILNRQGAIEEFTVQTSDYNSSTFTQKQGEKAFSGNYRAYEKEVREWMADSPEIMKELQQADSLEEVAKSQESNKENNAPKKNESAAKEEKTEKPKGLLAKLEAAQKKEAEMQAKPIVFEAGSTDMLLILNNYSAWYDGQNPGKIKYYFTDPPVRKLSPLEDFKERQAKQQAYLNREKEKTDAKKKINDLFANRTTTPSPENASAKDNVPVKKETFAAKLERIKADGNKVGVILSLLPVHVFVPTDQVSTGLTSYVAVEGDYLDETLSAAAQEFVTELNKELGTTEIEMIDMQKVPYRDSKYGKLDDWWASKYKVVFAYSLDPRLRTANEEIGGKVKFSASLNMIQSLIVREYIGGPGATKQDIITQVLNMGSFVTPTYAQDDQMTDVKAIYDKTLEKLAVPILSKIREERADGVKKLVEKKLN